MLRGCCLFGNRRVLIFAYGLFIGYLITALILNTESENDLTTREIYYQNNPIDVSHEHNTNEEITYYTIEDTNYTEEYTEDIRYNSVKLQILEAGINELIAKWKRSPLSKPKTHQGKVCERYTNESKEVKVHVLHVWRDESTHRQLTMATQFAAGKLPVMERLLRHWSGPVSFVLYSDEQSLRALPKTLLQTNSSLLFRDNIALHLVYQSGDFYPVNFLRNVALNNTDHKYVLLTDVDFIPSHGSYEYLLGALDASKVDKNKKQALVVPAFEFPNKTNIPEYPRNKYELLQLWKQKKVIQFHLRWPAGHGATNYNKWQTAEESYNIKYEYYYEPYIVIDRQGAPPYSQDFVGRHGNKVSHLLHVHLLGYDFVVLPNVFLVHYPHAYPHEGPDRNCSQGVLEAFKAKMNYTEPRKVRIVKKKTLKKDEKSKRKVIRKIIRRVIRKVPKPASILGTQT